MNDNNSFHKPVLLKESVASLKIKPEGIYIDATLGGGGHTNRILKDLSDQGRLIALDMDSEALALYKRNNQMDSRLQLFKANFKDLDNVLEQTHIKKVNGIIADLGISSYQIDFREKGFSYMDDKAPLDMRLSQSMKLSAANVINQYKKLELFRIFRDLGELKYKTAEKITRNIIKTRRLKKIKTAGDLKKAMFGEITGGSFHHNKILSNVFRAIRMEVNDELGNLKTFLSKAVDCLAGGGRLSVITFHSLEDRIVKKYFKKESTDCLCPAELPKCICRHKKRIKLINKKVIIPTKAEVSKNKRARSAKLRIVEKL